MRSFLRQPQLDDQFRSSRDLDYLNRLFTHSSLYLKFLLSKKDKVGNDVLVPAVPIREPGNLNQDQYCSLNSRDSILLNVNPPTLTNAEDLQMSEANYFTSMLNMSSQEYLSQNNELNSLYDANTTLFFIPSQSCKDEIDHYPYKPCTSSRYAQC